MSCTVKAVANIQPSLRKFLDEHKDPSIKKIQEAIQKKFHHEIPLIQWNIDTLSGLKVSLIDALWFLSDQLSKAEKPEHIQKLIEKLKSLKKEIAPSQFEKVENLIIEKQKIVDAQQKATQPILSISPVPVPASIAVPVSSVVGQQPKAGWGSRVFRVVAGGTIGYAVGQIPGAIFGALAALNNKTAVGGGIGYLTAGLQGGIFCVLSTMQADSIGKSIQMGLSQGLSMALMGGGNSFVFAKIQQFLGSNVLKATIANMNGYNLVQSLLGLIYLSISAESSNKKEQNIKNQQWIGCGMGLLFSSFILYQLAATPRTVG